MDKLEKLGFKPWFKNHLDSKQMAVHELARVLSVHRDSYIISKGDAEVFAEITGHFAYTAEAASDLPATGDWVYADFYDDETHAIIHATLPRRTLLKRKTAGKEVNIQLIASNIDVAFIVQSVDFNFNLRRLERYLVMVNDGGITPIILLSKCDLIPESEVVLIRASVLAIAPQAKVMAFSNLSGENIDTIKDALLPGNTYCLIGSSGVGKTTLLNSLLGSEDFATQSVSKKEHKGRHTTTSRQLIQLDNGAMIIDTPGMRELGSLAVDAGMEETFADIAELEQQCRFSNCSHSNEKGCAILAAINNGNLADDRYNNYLKMKSEAAFNEMSYLQKRHKDKAFGKMVKTTMKHKKR